MYTQSILHWFPLHCRSFPFISFHADSFAHAHSFSLSSLSIFHFTSMFSSILLPFLLPFVSITGESLEEMANESGKLWGRLSKPSIAGWLSPRGWLQYRWLPSFSACTQRSISAFAHGAAMAMAYCGYCWTPDWVGFLLGFQEISIQKYGITQSLSDSWLISCAVFLSHRHSNISSKDLVFQCTWTSALGSWNMTALNSRLEWLEWIWRPRQPRDLSRISCDISIDISRVPTDVINAWFAGVRLHWSHLETLPL